MKLTFNQKFVFVFLVILIFLLILVLENKESFSLGGGESRKQKLRKLKKNIQTSEGRSQMKQNIGKKFKNIQNDYASYKRGNMFNQKLEGIKKEEYSDRGINPIPLAPMGYLIKKMQDRGLTREGIQTRMQSGRSQVATVPKVPTVPNNNSDWGNDGFITNTNTSKVSSLVRKGQLGSIAGSSTSEKKFRGLTREGIQTRMKERGLNRSGLEARRQKIGLTREGIQTRMKERGLNRSGLEARRQDISSKIRLIGQTFIPMVRYERGAQAGAEIGKVLAADRKTLEAGRTINSEARSNPNMEALDALNSLTELNNNNVNGNNMSNNERRLIGELTELGL